MGHGTVTPRPLKSEELFLALRREGEDQQKRVDELADALAHGDYLEVAAMIDSLSAPLSQHSIQEEGLLPVIPKARQKIPRI